MKKYGLLLLSILLLIVCFLLAWYDDQLASTGFIFFAVPFMLFLFGCFVALLIACVVAIIRHRAYINFFSIGVLGLLILLILKFPFRNAKVKLELDLYEASRLKVVEMIKNDELRSEDGSGNVDLPMRYRMISASGQVYVLQNDEQGQVILFWIFRGMLSGSLCLVYSSGGEEMIRANETGHPITKVEQMKDAWYYVETDY